VGELLTRVGDPAEFDCYLAALRVEYKRSFVKLLNAIR
jgi:hypothetical protein